MSSPGSATIVQALENAVWPVRPISQESTSVTRVPGGPLRLAELPAGHVRALDRREIRSLRQAALGDSQPRNTQRPKRARPKKKPVQTTTAAARSVIGGDLPSRGAGQNSRRRTKSRRPSGHAAKRRD